MSFDIGHLPSSISSSLITFIDDLFSHQRPRTWVGRCSIFGNLINYAKAPLHGIPSSIALSFPFPSIVAPVEPGLRVNPLLWHLGLYRAQVVESFWSYHL